MSTDHFDLSSDPQLTRSSSGDSAVPRPFLGIQYTCCQTYGRLYRNADATAYTGRCPRCGAHLTVAIGTGGTSKRFFSAG